MSENVSKLLTRITTYDGPAGDPYDHEISLVDTTDQGSEPRAQELNGSDSPTPGARDLKKKSTRESLKGQFTRRSYAKYQQERYDLKTSSTVAVEETPSKPISMQISQRAESKPTTKTQAVDFAPAEANPLPVESGRDGAKKRRQEFKRLKEEVQEIDILYENQRGSFFCGIPLYSHSSLMPIDHSPWTNKDFKESAVNITNAQLPDPSWQWAWKNWYVDMSHDVDEEGWQYSFAFGRNWAWHGTHPWFHSFVRRRRWLRKRVKRDSQGKRGKHRGTINAHDMTGDYFTIHSMHDRSPVDELDGTAKTARPSSYISYRSTIDLDEPPEEVKDIASLLTALKFANIDREKITMVKKFVQHGGEELVYLKEHIPDIMSFLVFQNSRMQLLSYLKWTANEAREHRQRHEDEDKPEGVAESQRIDNLLAAVDAANAEIGGLEFWSDRKHVLKTDDCDSRAIRTIATIFDQPAPKPKLDNDPVEEIKGISAKAEIQDDNTQSIFRPTAQASTNEQDAEQEPEHGKVDKGKGRAHDRDSEDDQMEQELTPRLGPDDAYIPNQQD